MGAKVRERPRKGNVDECEEGLMSADADFAKARGVDMKQLDHAVDALRDTLPQPSDT
jgi:hypothetical protein